MIVLSPDCEELVIKWLLADADMSALVGTGVAAALPASYSGQKFVTLHQIDNTSTRPRWLDNDHLEIHALASNKADASRVIRTTEMALERLQGQRTSLGVVSNVETFGRGWFPDSTVTPARPMYRMSARISVHA